MSSLLIFAPTNLCAHLCSEFKVIFPLCRTLLFYAGQMLCHLLVQKASNFHLLNKAGTRHFEQTETINYDVRIRGSHGWIILPCAENDQWRLLQLLAKTS